MMLAMRAIYLTIPIAFALLAGTSVAADADAIFEKSVRPLLESKCYDCHSARSDEVKGNLRLDSLEAILKGGDNGPAIVAGDVENSFLLRAIRYQEADYQMPPSGRLPDSDVAAVEAWVKALEDSAKRPKSKRALSPNAQRPRVR
jgi:hypothetical protein